MVVADVAPELLGPVAALALALVMLALFYTGKILPRNVVPREDFKQLQEINAAMSERLTTLTTAVNELVTVVKYQQRNGGAH